MMLTADRRARPATHVVAEPPAALDQPDDHRDHRPVAHRLVDRRLDVGVRRGAIAGADLARAAGRRRAACAAAARTPRPASWRSSRGRPAPATSARRAAHGRSAARPPRRAPRAAATGRRRARSRSRRARRSRITAYIWRSSIASTAASTPLRLELAARCAAPPAGTAASSRRPASAGAPARSRRSVGAAVRGHASIPNTPRMITSSVTACIRGASANACADRPAVDLLASATSAIIST